MGLSCYPDHGSPVRRAREAARKMLPCPGCGSPAEPAMRRPRPFSRSWAASPSTYFGCRECGHVLAPISGPAADRAPEVAGDLVPDPEGTVRALLERDSLALRGLGLGTAGDAESRYGALDRGGPGSPIRLGESLGPALDGIDLRLVTDPGPVDGRLVVLTRFGLPWVPLHVRPVEEIELPPLPVEPADSGLFGVSTVEAAFAVSIDRAGRWRLREVRMAPGRS